METICDNCGKKFSNVYTLNAHIRQVHENKKPYKCELCELSFGTKYKLNRHFQGIHSETRDKFCEICGHSFKTREMLIKHHRIHFRGPFTCPVCQEVFNFKAGYDHHFKIKHQKPHESDAKPVPKVRHYECKICHKQYKNLKSLKNHEENHAKVIDCGPNKITSKKRMLKSVSEELICFHCRKSFDSKKDFEIHLTSHEEEYPVEEMIIEEEACDDEIIDEILVEEPEDIESIKEDAICIFDYSKIKQESPQNIFDIQNSYEDLENPELIIKTEHSQDFVKTENNHADVNLHQVELSKPSEKYKRNESKPLEKIICDICGMFFMNKSHLRRHQARKHQEKSDYKYECDTCCVKFLLRYDLQRHMIKHISVRNVECPQCKKQFKTKSSLDCHIKFIHNQDRSQTEKQFICNICLRSYFHKRHLDYHMRKHTDDRRYSCKECNKSFLYSDAVKWHQIRTHKYPAPFTCNLCLRKFIHQKTYETHLKEHDETGSLAVTCPICNKKISEKRHLPRHIRTHLKKGFTCDFCNESFKERFQLTKHLLQCEDKHNNKEVEIIYETVVQQQ